MKPGDVVTVADQHQLDGNNHVGVIGIIAERDWHATATTMYVIPVRAGELGPGYMHDLSNYGCVRFFAHKLTVIEPDGELADEVSATIAAIALIGEGLTYGGT